MARGKVDGKVVIVTGSTQGIGEGVAVHLAEKGARGLVITGRDEKRGERVIAKLESMGCDAEFVRAELASEKDVRSIAAACDARFGRCDGLVNAAGVTTRGTLENTTVELWDLIFAVNVRAPFILSQEAVRLMKKGGRRGGSIVNIISMSGHGGQPFLVPYSTSKGALATFTKNIAHGLRSDRIRVNGIMLGWTSTPAEDVIQKEEGAPTDWLEKAEARQPFGRLIRPRDVATMVTHLISDEAEMITGALIDFDQNVMGAYD
jgi:NAD(P)-dependent dehydrogenase (short-subunit alcohol dehydrogenase family)